MHIHNTAPLEHEHSYLSGHEIKNERRTWWVVGITSAMMLAEITCGLLFNSMALLAEGWHMSTHAGALGITAFAYFFARKQASNPSFTFGTGKVSALGGFTSAIVLAMVALLIIFESGERFLHPKAIVFNEAIAIASLGLLINIICAWLLRDDHTHTHDDNEEPQEHHEHHHDHNLRAAYIHVLADAFTSILTISALIMGKYWGWVWMDPAMGIVGSFVIANWSVGLIRQSSKVLLDSTPDTALETQIRTTIERDADNKITDLHLWCIAPGKFSAIISLVTDMPQPPHHYKSLISGFDRLAHVTVEVNKCGSL